MGPFASFFSDAPGDGTLTAGRYATPQPISLRHQENPDADISACPRTSSVHPRASRNYPTEHFLK